MLKYKDNERPYKVIFTNLVDYEPSWLYFINKSKYLKK